MSRIYLASTSPRRVELLRSLGLLRGRVHRVISGVALYCARTRRCLTDAEETEVKFAAMTDEEVQWYISTREPLDKAGACGVQGKGAVFIEWIRGSYSNVVGLPLPRSTF